MIARLLAAAAFSAVLTTTALAQMAGPPANNPSADNSPANNAGASPSATGAPTSLSSQPATNGAQIGQSQRPTHGSASTSGLSSSPQTAQGHEQENGVADKLNACEAKPMSERQACFEAATRM